MIHKPMRTSTLQVRRMSYHLTHWGNEDAPLLLMVHGWMDVGASFQFIVDEMQRDWHIVAPDWRGFGKSQWTGADSYWFMDYLADLDALVNKLSPQAPIDLIGHSMGGNVAMLYAGIRPDRIRKLVNIEGFGLPGNKPEQAPSRLGRWLDELRHQPTLRPYENREGVKTRLKQNNARLTEARADFLADHWAAPHTIVKNADTAEWRIAADPRHKIINPSLYRVEEIMACWRGIKAPVLWINGVDSTLYQQVRGWTEFADRLRNIANLHVVDIEDAGHMVHHDQPGKAAALIEDFLVSGAP